MTIFEILKYVKYISCQIFICFVTSNKKLDLTSVSVLRIHHLKKKKTDVKIRKWRDQKSVQRIWVGGWEGGVLQQLHGKSLIWSSFNYPQHFSLSYSGCFSCKNTQSIASEKLTDFSNAEGTCLISCSLMPLKLCDLNSNSVKISDRLLKTNLVSSGWEKREFLFQPS